MSWPWLLSTLRMRVVFVCSQGPDGDEANFLICTVPAVLPRGPLQILDKFVNQRYSPVTRVRLWRRSDAQGGEKRVADVISDHVEYEVGESC